MLNHVSLQSELKLVHVATYANGETEPKYHEKGVSALTHKVSLEPYRRASAKIMKIFQSYCQKFQRASIDEAYLDVTEEVNRRISRMNLTDEAESGDESDEPLVTWSGAGHMVGEEVTESRGWGDLELRIGAEISQEIRDTVFRELGYTCSTGIAHNKTLAKLCSALNKPNKQTVLRESQVLQFMGKLPMSKIRNLGGKLGAEVEAELQVETAGDLWKYSLDTLKTKFGDSTGVWLYNICRGICFEDVTVRDMQKSMAACKSLRPSITKDDQARHWLGILSSELFTRIFDDYDLHRRWPRTLVLHYKVTNLPAERSKSCPFPPRSHVLSPDVISAKAWGLFASDRMYPCSRMALTVLGFVKEESGGDVLAKWLVKGAVGGEGEKVGDVEGGGEGVGSGGGVEGGEGVPMTGTPSTPHPPPRPSKPSISNFFTTSNTHKDETVSEEADDHAICEECHQRIAKDDKAQAEHRDFHFAMALSKEERSSGGGGGGSGSPGAGVKRKGSGGTEGQGKKRKGKGGVGGSSDVGGGGGGTKLTAFFSRQS
ncbi:DNA-directed DNA polymerase eta rad30 [Rhizophlyctis rosea]|nr:DNA-directed DNA polymerase eta rad30 [Rhizophlyctis rosea]